MGWLEMSGEKSLNELFLAACEDGEEAKVNAAIVLGVDVNTKDATSGWTGLMWAISYRHESIVDILLAHPDIDINGKTNNGWFPLSQAAWHGLTSVVAKLGRIPALRGVNDQGGLFERTPLNLATTQGKESNGRLTPLNLATYYGKDSKLLLENNQFRIFMGWVRADYGPWINDPL